MDLAQHTSDEAREAELTRLIEKRHDQRVLEEGERAAQEMYAESVQAYQERERQQIRWEWVRYFDRMAENHRKLSEDYERRAEELCDEVAHGVFPRIESA